MMVILLNSNLSLSGVNTAESTISYSQISFYIRGQTRFEVGLTLSRDVLLINETNPYYLSLTPHRFDKHPNVTLDRIEISSLRFDFYEEDRETLTASNEFFYVSNMYNRSRIKIPYDNTTSMAGNFSIPDWWEPKTMWLGLAVDYSEYFFITTGDNYSSVVTSHSPKLFGPLAIHGFPPRQVGFGSFWVIISLLILYSQIRKKRKS